jgi:hypothetical protein
VALTTFFTADFIISRHVKQFFPKRYTPKVNNKKVLLHKAKLLCSKLSGACQVYSCFKIACDVTDFEAYTVSFSIDNKGPGQKKSFRVAGKGRPQ